MSSENSKNNIPFFKTKIGQHDFHKVACFEYCKLDKGKYCPFIKNDEGLADGARKISETVRWTDLADAKFNQFNSSSTDKKNSSVGYKIPFPDVKSVSVSSTEAYAVGFTCWCDGSGFQYDRMSQNLIGPGSNVQSVYDITNYGVKHYPLRFSEWNAWVDKIQYDYRFGQVSDVNAECVLFPNVDNPWMFTQYVFKGIGGDSKKCAFSLPQEYVVQPPIYDPQTLQIINGDLAVDNVYADYDGKYRDDYFIQNSNNNSCIVKQFREIVDWNQLHNFSLSDVGGNENIYEQLRQKHQSLSSPVKDIGVKLYRAKIPVQSVKWGQHGNVPPGTIDMTAPQDWFKPQQSVVKIKAVYNANVGAPFYSNYQGIIFWKGDQALVYNINVDFANNVIEDNDGNILYYNYQLGDQFIQLDMPYEDTGLTKKILKPSSIIKGQEQKQEYVHFGCSLLYGRNGQLHCSYLDALTDKTDIENMQYYFDFSDEYGFVCHYSGNQKKCPYYVNNTPDKQQIASYQSEIAGLYQQNFQNAASGLLMSSLMGVSGLAIAGSTMIQDSYTKINEYIKNLGKPRDIETNYTVTYQPVLSEPSPAKLNKKDYNQFGKGVQIVPGTGKYAFDNKAGFQGGDTNILGDINTLSFNRFFKSIMHCSNQSYCNMIVGQSQAQGFSLRERAGGQGKCRYFNNGLENKDSLLGCPYNCVPKRAVQYCNVAFNMTQIIGRYINAYQEIVQRGIWDLNWDNGLFPYQSAVINKYDVYYNDTPGNAYTNVDDETSYGHNFQNNDKDKIVWIVFDKWAIAQIFDDVAVVAVKLDKSNNQQIDDIIPFSSDFGGAALFKSINMPSDYHVFCKFKTLKYTKTLTTPANWDQDKRRVDKSKSEVNSDDTGIIEISCYKVLDAFYWFQPLNNNGAYLYDGTHWSFDSQVLPASQIGEIPEYIYDEKDKVKGSNAKVWKVPENLRQHVDKNGFWFCRMQKKFTIPFSNCVMIDNSQKFIGGYHPQYKDYSKIGQQFMQQIISDVERQGQGIGDNIPSGGEYNIIPQPVNKKGYWINQSGEYIVDQLSLGIDNKIAFDQKRDNTSGPGICISFRKSNTYVDGQTGEQTSPKVINAAVFSNDPFDLISNVFPGAKEKDEITGEIKGRPMLIDPKKEGEKYFAPCYVRDTLLLPTCRESIYCKHCDYYLSQKYISPDIKKCPWCGTPYLHLKGSFGLGLEAGDSWKGDEYYDDVMKKFFKICAIGNVDVWAPPGTAIKTNAYFWKHQTQITNALKRQIRHRLGSMVIGSYFMNEMTPSSQFTLGYPQFIGKFQKIDIQNILNPEYDNERYGKNHISWSHPLVESVGMYNKNMPRHMIPEFYGKSDEGFEDEGVIAPYSSAQDDALKLISWEQISDFRNKLQPMIAYTSESYSGEYPCKRASYNLRQSINQPIIFQGRRCMIAPVVLAVTSDGCDSYQDYYSGDMVYGNVRQHFPSGYTWWHMKQVMGGRCTSNKGGTFHMDDGGGNLGIGIMSGGSNGLYTIGTVTQAKCAVFIHGLLPLDKNILSAYLIFGTSSEVPSKDPIGRSWTGGPVMYHHYHAMSAAPNRQDWAGGKKGQPHWGDGITQHLHGTAGYPTGVYFDDIGKEVDTRKGNAFYADDVSFLDESAYRLWGKGAFSLYDDRNKYYDDNFSKMIGNLSGLYDVAFYRNVGTVKSNVYSVNDEKNMPIDPETGKIQIPNSGYTPIGKGYYHDSFEIKEEGFEAFNLMFSQGLKDKKFQYLITDDQNNLISKYTYAQTWLKGTSQLLQKEIDSNTYKIQVGASDGTMQNSTSYIFQQTNISTYNDIVTNQSQGITGYFDMNWTNTKGYSFEKYKVDYGKDYKTWDAPVIFQNNDVSYKYNGTANDSGSFENLGNVPRVLDVSDIVRKLYNDRISRDFICTGGAEFVQVLGFDFYDPKHDGEIDQDVKIQNFKLTTDYFHDYYILNEGFSYPKLENISFIPEIDSQGQKYQLATKDIEIVINVSSYPVFINKENNCYIIQKENKEVSPKTLGQGSIKNYQDLNKTIQTLFSDVKFKQKKKISNNSLLLIFENKFFIKKVDNSCYGLFGLIDGEYNVGQNRIVQLTNHSPGYHPKNLIYSQEGRQLGSWYYDVYQNKKQFFVMDLLRAPLLQEQRSWRQKPSSVDYSNVKCPSPSCNAHIKTCAIAANEKGKYFDKSNPYCPLCDTSLDNCQGVLKTLGDGIKTYIYDKPFNADPFIARIQIQPYLGSFSILYKQSAGNMWKSLLSVVYEYDVYKKKYVFKVPSDYGNNFFIDVVTVNEDNGYTELEISLNGLVYPNLRARFLKIQCDSVEYDNNESFNIVENRGYQIIVQKPNLDFNTLGDFSFANYNALIDNFIDVNIVSAQILDSSQGKLLKISLDRSLDLTETYSTITFKSKKYIGGIQSLRIFGLHYKTEQGDNFVDNSGDMFLVMNGGYDFYKTYLSNYGHKHQLPQVPIEILNVGVGDEDGQQILLRQTDNIENLYWETIDIGSDQKNDDESSTQNNGSTQDGSTQDGGTQNNGSTQDGGTQQNGGTQNNGDTQQIEGTQQQDKGTQQNGGTQDEGTQDEGTQDEGTQNNGEALPFSYQKITGGNYYYDYKNGNIVLPQKNRNGIRFADFEADLMKIKGLSFKPKCLFVTYWGGNGKSITLPARASGNGPSYMLQKNAITQIVEGQKMSQVFHGDFCKILDPDGNVKSPKEYSWIVYNNKPSTLTIQDASLSNKAQGSIRSYNAGEFKTPNFLGNEICDKGCGRQSDSEFIKLFGENCQRCQGICETEVTFTGKPNTIFSGEIIVRALAETQYTINTGGYSYTYTQRTGGIKSGIIICSIVPADSNGSRVTKCFSKPKLVIFASQANKYQ